MTRQTCTCNAYKFPHRQGGGRCNSCRHGKNWPGLSEALYMLNNGGLGNSYDWCERCAEDEGYRGERSECLTAQERNPGYRAW